MVTLYSKPSASKYGKTTPKVSKHTFAASLPHLDSSINGLIELDDELLEDDSLLLLLTSLEETLLSDEGVSVLELALEGATLHAPNTKPINIGDKRNAFFILFISPY